MKRKYFQIPVLLMMFCCVWIHAQSQNKAPQTILLDGAVLARNAKLVTTGDAVKKKALEQLRSSADKIVAAGKLYSVMHKAVIPPCGNKHDYMSQAPYFWPDTTKPNGLPYINKDGERNPEIDAITDKAELVALENDVEQLSLAYYFTKNEKYAALASKLLKTWFLDTSTFQKPNLNFGQGIPGISTGRNYGIIETRWLSKIVDGAILLRESKSWSKADHAALQKWFTDFLNWLTTSSQGKEEGATKNNHGTYYDVQVLDFALFTGQTALAKAQVEITKQRIASQVTPDGSQPKELARTKSWDYVNMNLLGFCLNARLADHIKADLWHYETPSGSSIRKCLEWVMPYYKKEKPWVEKQIKKIEFAEPVLLLEMAAAAYHKPEYNELAKTIGPDDYNTFLNQLCY